MKEKWSMSSSGITEFLNIFISRFRCWGSMLQITEQPLMSLCPYLLSLLTACYLQFYIPPGETKWMLRQCNGWKIQKLIKSAGGAWKCNQKTCAGWDYWGTGRLLWGRIDPWHEAVSIYITVFMSLWHDLIILSNESHKEKRQVVWFFVCRGTECIYTPNTKRGCVMKDTPGICTYLPGSLRHLSY